MGDRNDTADGEVLVDKLEPRQDVGAWGPSYRRGGVRMASSRSELLHGKVHLMARRMSNNRNWWLGGAALAVAGLGLVYLKTGLGREKDAALIPDALEEPIDRVVEALKEKFGKQWVDNSAEVLAAALGKTLPKSLRVLIDVVCAVEQEAKSKQMSSEMKRKRAVALAKERGLGATSVAAA